MINANQLGALEAGAAIAAGTLTAEALVRSCLERIEQREDVVGAWIYLNADNALAEARKRDQEPSKGPLHGVPVGIKDVIDTGDMPTAYGSEIYAGFRPAADASSVALARAAGMVILGKTVSTEFALRQPGKTRNPHNPEHTPGGSSQGSAASVADFMVPLGVGTQTGGSVIRPASFCGVVGFKPTWCTIPRMGLKIICESLDTIGVMSRSVSDAAAFVQALSGWPLTPLVPLSAAPKLGFCRSPAWSEAKPATIAAMDEAVCRLRAAGAHVEDVVLPEPWEAMPDAHAVIQAVEAARSLTFETENHWQGISDNLRKALTNDLKSSQGEYRKALDTAARGRVVLDEQLTRVDALITPAAPGEAPKDLTFTGDPVLNRIWTAAGNPCVTVPGLSGPLGLPVGVQIVGSYADDATTLAVADWVHKAIVK
jgi:Asp-tRNA(Asn)/Glu-tRNA(Gln) amidotransferase A subunit family amidase